MAAPIRASARLPTPAQLQAVAAVADHGSFTAAAAELGTTQSSVSQAVRQLERRLGAPLFRRGPRGSVATEVGARVVVHARQVLLLLEQLGSEGEDDEPIRGTIRIASFRSIAMHILPSVFGTLRERHPELRIELDDGCLQLGDPEAAVLEGRAHLGLGRLPMSSQLVTFRFAEDEYMIVMPATVVGDGDEVWRRLARHPLIQYGNEALGLETAAMLADRGLNVVPLLRMSEDSSILAAVARGVGFAVMPRLAVEPLVEGVALWPLPRPVPRALGLGVKPSMMRFPVVRAVISALLNRAGLDGRREAGADA